METSRMSPAKSPTATLCRQSSIETEPRTLDYRQIEFAREAALCVINTRSFEEAFQIFTEGLEHVTSARKKHGDIDAVLMDLDEDKFKCSANNKFPREVATAPF